MEDFEALGHHKTSLPRVKNLIGQNVHFKNWFRKQLIFSKIENQGAEYFDFVWSSCSVGPDFQVFEIFWEIKLSCFQK